MATNKDDNMNRNNANDPAGSTTGTDSMGTSWGPSDNSWEGRAGGEAGRTSDVYESSDEIDQISQNEDND